MGAGRTAWYLLCALGRGSTVFCGIVNATQCKQYARTRPSFTCTQKGMRPIYTTTHWHCTTTYILGGCCERNPLFSEEDRTFLQCSTCSQALTVTHLYQQTTTHHSDTTWDIRHTTCGGSDICHVSSCDVYSPPATTTSRSFGFSCLVSSTTSWGGGWYSGVCSSTSLNIVLCAAPSMIAVATLVHLK